MNVLHIDEQRGWRGGEQQASYLIQGLARRGYGIVIAGRHDGLFLKAEHGGAPVIRVAAPFASEFDPLTAVILARVVKRHRIDILHAHTSHAHTAACLARRVAGRGKVVVSRRVDFVPRTDFFNRWKYSWPDRIVAISDAIGGVMRACGIDESRLAVVHSATDPARFNVSPSSRRVLGVPDGAPLLGNVAALVGHKDQATLLDAMPVVLKALPALHLVIAGEGELRPDLEAHIAKLRIGGSVHLLGQRSDVPNLLRALDAFVLSSKQEGLGTSVLDAMTCGVPVAATAAGGIPEMVLHEQTGLLSTPGDPASLAANIVRLFQQPGLAQTMARNAQELVQRKYSVDAMVEGNIRVYESLSAR